MYSFLKTALFFLSVLMLANASDVIVTVNNKPITVDDAKQFLASSNTNLQFSSLSQEQKLAVVERLVERELFAEAAKNAKIDQSPQFNKELERIKKELMINLWIKSQIDSMIISDGEARDFYDNNKEKFTEPTRIRARHIVVNTKKEANSIIAALKPLSGDLLKRTFIAIASNSSLDATRTRGGDLGEFSKEQMSPDFSKVAWNLDAGHISLAPIQTPMGYHIIYVEQKLQPRVIPYNEAKKDIVFSLKQKQFGVYLAQLAKEFKRTAKIVVSRSLIQGK
ncbi:MAG: peptidylprolyl isomerase [Sulfurovaceae bacterium]|nr:peptidylprolyl isomerase [Sulfurovaceae bacterium]